MMIAFILGIIFYFEYANNILMHYMRHLIYEPWHEISNNVVCATIKDPDQPTHTRSLIRALASRRHIL